MEAIGYIVLISGVGVIVYGFYKILKYMLDGIRSCDD